MTRLDSRSPRRLGYSIPVTQGRGAGLGNECIAWAKAAIGAEVFGLKLLSPQWGLNRRGYTRELGGHKLDWVAHKAIGAVPHLRIDEAKVDETGHPFDYFTAMTTLRDDVGLRPRVISHEGMNGGYLSIRSARPFLRGRLLGRPDRVLDLEARGPRVVLHIRGDDFASSQHGPSPGEFSKRIPSAWYSAIATAIRHSCPSARFLVVTDDWNLEVRRLAREVDALVRPRSTVLGDLDLMASSDLLVCSVSSFSLLAAFLGDMPYIWFRNHLLERNGWLSVWGHEPAQLEGPTRQNEKSPDPWGSRVRSQRLGDSTSRSPGRASGDSFTLSRPPK